MKMIMQVRLPNEDFNEAVRDGTAGDILQRIFAETKPEAVYFTSQDGNRGAIIIVNVEKESDIPKFAEPWFLSFDADVEFQVCMSPEDLGAAGLDDLGEMWS